MSHLSLPPQAETEGTAKYQGGPDLGDWFSVSLLPPKKPRK